MAGTGTGRPVGRPPKPIEEKRRTGNPGKRALPDRATVTLLPSTGGTVPEPSRPLGPVGLALWRDVWTAGATWLAAGVDVHGVLILCEQLDERERLRFLAAGEFSKDVQTSLRAVEAQITGGLAALGFTPTDRARLGVAEVKPPDRISSIMSRKSAN